MTEAADAPPEPEPNPRDGRRGVAAFDFDGTITRRDSLLPFLALVRGRARLAAALVAQAPGLARMALGRGDRDAEKERLIGRLLGGLDTGYVTDWGVRYAGSLNEERPFRSEVLALVDHHRARSHTLVIVSAAPAVYLEPLGALLGFDAVLATRCEVGSDGRLTGRLDGPNVRGDEKAARLRAWLGPRPYELWAYGDSQGDAALLAMADHPTRVQGTRGTGNAAR